VDGFFECEYIYLKIQRLQLQPIEVKVMSSMKPSEWAMLVVLSVFWGGSFFFIEVALRGFQPFAIVLLRVVLAAVILTGVVCLGGRRLPSSPGVWGSYFVMGALNNAIPFSLIIWGQTRIDSGVASILNATTPIFTVLLAHFLTSDERLTLRKIGGVFIGFLGVYIMLQPELKDGFSWRGLGQVAVLGAAVSYSLAGIFGKRFKKTSPVGNAAGMLICSSVIMLPLVLMTGALSLSRPTAAAVAALCGLATVSTAVAYLLYFRVLASAGATNVLLVTFLIPVGALLLGVGVLGEVIHILEYAGMGCIFTGLMVIDGRVLSGIKNRVDSRQKKRSFPRYAPRCGKN
jgi:drug/metabolite transporter (DMT)-like permease